VSTIELTFWGAAGQVTGSCHLLNVHGTQVALDAGLFQGHRDESKRLNEALPFDPRHFAAVVLSHAHIDHSGRLPLLVSRQFDSAIHATPATRDLCAIMLPDSAHIQESDFRWLQKKGRAGPSSDADVQPRPKGRGRRRLDTRHLDQPSRALGGA
jgi:metallo-beta-lactamase family protein